LYDSKCWTLSRAKELSTEATQNIFLRPISGGTKATMSEDSMTHKTGSPIKSGRDMCNEWILEGFPGQQWTKGLESKGT
jgi:hypothetical protein